MTIHTITHFTYALLCIHSELKQTEESHNQRVSAIVCAAILLLMGIGNLTHLFSFGIATGWACVSLRLICLLAGLFLRCINYEIVDFQQRALEQGQRNPTLVSLA